MTQNGDGALVADATAWLGSQRDSMERLLRELVEVSSWTHDKAGNDAATAILRRATPGTLETIPSASFGDHSAFHGRRKASAGGVVLVGHIDTVFPKDKFAGYRSDGKIARGPGVLDMKGGLVVATFALKALREVGALDRLSFSYVVVSDEEVGSPDSAPHLRRIATGAKASLVFESGRAGDAIVTRRKGTGSFTAVATGRAAHAGNAHQDGANAIWAVSRFVDRVQALTDYSRGNTVNVGKISGGMGKNTVPDHAEALADMRYVTSKDADELRARVLAAAQDTGVAGTRVEVKWGPGRGPMERTEASAALLSAYAECQRECGLGHGEMGLVGGGSDAATTSSVGVPSIDGLGPRGQGFHTVDELMELDTLVPKAQALARYLLRHGLA
jgi:glutamate carboxypeptidase